MKVLKMFKTAKFSTSHQCLIGLAVITLIAITSYISIDYIGYRVVALILLMVVSILAMLFEIIPVLLTAIFSALIWNYFFIPPTLDFYIGTAEDVLMFLMYFFIALINAVLTFKIRQFEKKSREKEGRERTIKLYNTLLNSLSHELRTPISTIIGSIDTIMENGNKLSEYSRNELYNEIATASFRLNRQVGNLLDMSRLEAGILQPKLDWCDVNELVHNVIQNNKDLSINHFVKFDQEDHLPLFKIDRGLIEPVLHNIVHNALLYTPDGSEVHIRVNHENGKCRFEISDNGSGFPPEEINYVFDKFYRLPKNAVGGTGLGLSIAKGFTEAHKGNIYLENLSAGGTKFTIEIPAESASINELDNEQTSYTYN